MLKKHKRARLKKQRIKERRKSRRSHETGAKEKALDPNQIQELMKVLLGGLDLGDLIKGMGDLDPQEGEDPEKAFESFMQAMSEGSLFEGGDEEAVPDEGEVN
jgi:capsid protein